MIRLLYLATTVAASLSSSHTSQSHPLNHQSGITQRAVGDGKLLKIMPIGDSITEGDLSDIEGGYRMRLRALPTKAGSKVDFIGSRQVDSIPPLDNQHEGYGGKRISEIQAGLVRGGKLRDSPDIVLIHAGTNDVVQEPARESYEQAATRLGNLIDTVLDQVPTAVVLVGKIIQDDIPGAQARTDTYNSQIPPLVANRTRQGYKIRMVDFSLIGSGSDQLADRLHPNAAGYAEMARLWFDALQDLPSSWLAESASSSSSSSTALSSSTSTALPSSTSTALPSSTSTALPSSTSTALPSSTSTALPSSTSTALPSSTSTALPSSTSPTTQPSPASSSLAPLFNSGAGVSGGSWEGIPGSLVALALMLTFWH